MFKLKKNHVTKISRKNRRENVIKDLKEKSARNDLKGIWKTIKSASNISSGKIDQNSNIDPNTANQFFTSVGMDIQSSIATSPSDDFSKFMSDRPQCSFSTFNEVTEESVKQYIEYIADRRLERIRLEKLYDVHNPFPWMSEVMDLRKEKNFFETRVTEYQTGGVLQWG
jgi:hypothetical protein